MKEICRRKFLKSSIYCFAGLGVLKTWSDNWIFPYKKCPNFLIIFLDNAGYSNLNIENHRAISTPNLNVLADEGITMNQFYTSASFTSSSQAALLTGRHSIRNGIVRPLLPSDKVGLSNTEKTLAGLLKEKCYKTAYIGRWCLGKSPYYLPKQYGFDYSYGSIYNCEKSFYQNSHIKQYTAEGVCFIKKSKNNPFFVLLNYTIPYVPLERKKNLNYDSKEEIYCDLIKEIDSGIGEVLNLLKDSKLNSNTFVIFISNKDLFLPKIKYDSVAKSFVGAEKTSFEDNLRIPFIARFPGILPEGIVSNETGTIMDIFTTFLSLTEIDIPKDRPIDGQNLIPVLQGKRSSKHEFIYYYWKDQLIAIRRGKYKLHFKADIKEWRWDGCEPYELYNFETNQIEICNTECQKADLIRELKKEAERFTAGIARRRENQELITKLLYLC